MTEVRLIEVGHGDRAHPPRIGGGSFQAGADWLFRAIREGAMVRMNYAVGGYPAQADHLLLVLDDEDLEDLGLIEDRSDPGFKPWADDYADQIVEFLKANAEQLRVFMKLEDEEDDDDEK